MNYLNFRSIAFSLIILITPFSSALHAISDIEVLRNSFDGDWVSITGDVSGITAERFTLDYDKGKILVEMDDWDQFKEINLIDIGDRVTVSGRIDNSFYEKKTIEAFRVYSHTKHSYYYASSADDEGDLHAYDAHVTISMPDGTWINISGKVISVNGREFTLDTGQFKFIVDTDEMEYNPMDKAGFQKVKKGDYLHVTGYVDVDLFEKNEIKSVIIEKLF